MQRVNQILKIIGVIALIGIFVWIYIMLADFSPRVDTNAELLERIKKLELKIDSLNLRKDSLRVVIDSTHIKIITNEKHYKERINTIIVQPASADSEFIVGYIGLNSGQVAGIDSSRTREIKN